MSVTATYIAGPEEQLTALAARRAISLDQLANLPGLRFLDLDKSWEALTWLLSPAKRKEKELESISDDDVDIPPDIFMKALEGTESEPIGALDLGYGPPWKLSVALVQEAATALARVTADDLRQQYNPELMDEHWVYPDGWVDDAEDRFNEYLQPLYVAVREFFDSAAAAREAVLILFV
jgi:hypothetical protein